MRVYLSKLGLVPSQNILVHASFRSISNAFPKITPDDIINILKNIISPSGSIIFPAFTYCYKIITGGNSIFDRLNSKDMTDELAEAFRSSEGVQRTSSPTHSFSLWGKAKEAIDYRNSPASPLGYGSVIDWLAKEDNSFILLIGKNFSSLTICHYIEVISQVPYLKIPPLEYLSMMEIGVSTSGEQELKEVPGCSKSFTRFEEYLLQENFIFKFIRNGLQSYYIPIKPLLNYGKDFLKSFPMGFICEKGSCRICDGRYYLKKEPL